LPWGLNDWLTAAQSWATKTPSKKTHRVENGSAGPHRTIPWTKNHWVMACRENVRD